MTPEQRKILMVPGWQGLQATNSLADELRRRGRNVEVVDYDSKNKTLKQILRDRVIPELKKNPHAILFGHSTGGMLLRRAAAMNPKLLANRRVVLAAPAFHGSPGADVGRWVGKIPGTPDMLRDKLLGDLRWSTNTKPHRFPDSADVTVISGNRRDKIKNIYGVLKAVTMAPFGKSDGVIPASTYANMPGVDKFLVGPYSHSGLLTNEKSKMQLADLLTRKPSER